MGIFSKPANPRGRGVSIYFAVGHWANFHFDTSKMGVRIVAGWFAVNLCFYDVDAMLGIMSRLIK